jgi:hypothetical protein
MPVLFTGLITMAVAQLFDFGTFVVMVRRHGPSAEANPLVAQVLDTYGIPLLALAKLALIVLVGSIALILTARASTLERRMAAGIIGIAIIAGIVGGGTNSLAFAMI